MATVMRQGTGQDAIGIILGVIGIACGLFFFLQKFGIIQTAFEIMDTAYIYFFAGFTLVAGIMILSRSLGLIR